MKVEEARRKKNAERLVTMKRDRIAPLSPVKKITIPVGWRRRKF